MLTENEFRIEELRGVGGALWLDVVAAFEGIRAAFSTRATLSEGPLAGYVGPAVLPDRRINEEYVARLCATLGFSYGRLATGGQVHGVRVTRVAVAERRRYEETDALVTAVEDAPLGVFTADCVPAVLWAPREAALAVVHAGWRGTTAKIIAAAVGALAREWAVAPETVSLFLGPAIGVCCYEVGEDVEGAAAAVFGRRASQVLRREEGRVYFDLHRANDLIAQEAGLLAGNIYRVRACTYCDPLFSSWRREGEAAGRMIAVAAIKGRGARNDGF